MWEIVTDTTTLSEQSSSKFKVPPEILLLVLVVLVAVSVSEGTGIEGTASVSEEPKICGRVHTSTNDTVVLREGSALSELEFAKIKKLEGAKFLVEFDEQSKCAIQVCGFAPWGDPYHKDYIGTTSDYSTCQFYSEKSTPAITDIYDERFNTSSISCGFNKREADCTYTCPDRALNLKDSWSDNDCAVLYRETRCNSCYLDPILLSKGTNYSTDNSVQIHTMVVRESCLVKQYSPAFKRMWRLHELPQPLEYAEGPTENNVVSAFQGEPEFYHCDCYGDQTTLPPNTTSTAAPEKLQQRADGTVLGAVVGGVVLVVGLFGGGIMWRIKRRNRNDDDEKRISSVTNITMSSKMTNYHDSGDDSDGDPFSPGSSWINNVDLSSFDTGRQDFDIEALLDEGNFGQVCQGNLRVAIKRVRAGIGAEEERELALRSLQQEMKILTLLGSHKNVVRLLGVNVGDLGNCELFLIMELCRCSLKSYINSTVKPRVRGRQSALVMNKLVGGMEGSNGYSDYMPEFQICMDTNENSSEIDLEQVDPEMLLQFYQWIQQIACGMQYIQSKRIIHVDLATRNVLLTRNLTAKIGDFGLSKKMYVSNYVTSRKDSFPIRWVAPESLTNYRYSHKSDVWSFGVTVWEIFSLGEDPYGGMDGFQVIHFITIQKERLKLPPLAPRDVYSKLLQCWQEDPNERPSFDELEMYFDVKCEDVQIPPADEQDV